MASRQEEKEARRRERQEQEERERRAATRNKRLQYVVGGILAAGVVAAVVVALMASGGSDDDSGVTAPSGEKVSLPEPAILDEEQAAKAAGCTVEQVPNEGQGHEEREFTPADYDHNPPTSGPHFPNWSDDGIYAAGETPPLGELVHTLEHGRINVQYKPGTDPELVAELEAFLAENEGYHLLLYENATQMEPQVVATAWDHVLSCPDPNPKMWDAMRTFYEAHVDRAPERVP